MFVVDTNLLLYAAERSFPEHQECRRLLDQWRRGPFWCLTWGIVYEFMRVSTHPRVFSRPWKLGDAWGFVDVLLDSPGARVLAPSDRHREVAAQVASELSQIRGNLVHDLTTAVLMREHGIPRIYTRDTDFHRFPWVDVVDPLG